MNNKLFVYINPYLTSISFSWEGPLVRFLGWAALIINIKWKSAYCTTRCTPIGPGTTHHFLRKLAFKYFDSRIADFRHVQYLAVLFWGGWLSVSSGSLGKWLIESCVMLHVTFHLNSFLNPGIYKSSKTTLKLRVSPPFVFFVSIRASILHS